VTLLERIDEACDNWTWTSPHDLAYAVVRAVAEHMGCKAFVRSAAGACLSVGGVAKEWPCETCRLLSELDPADTQGGTR
jgi:hypothetical protein